MEFKNTDNSFLFYLKTYPFNIQCPYFFKTYSFDKISKTVSCNEFVRMENPFLSECLINIYSPSDNESSDELIGTINGYILNINLIRNDYNKLNGDTVISTLSSYSHLIQDVWSTLVGSPLLQEVSSFIYVIDQVVFTGPYRFAELESFIVNNLIHEGKTLYGLNLEQIIYPKYTGSNLEKYDKSIDEVYLKKLYNNIGENGFTLHTGTKIDIFSLK